MDVIAEHRLVAMFPDSGPVPVVVRVGRPFVRQKGEYACPVQAEGLRLWEGPTDISGEGSWHALMLGLRFLREMLAAEVKRGAVFHWEGSDHAISVEQLFVLGPIE